MVRLTKRRGVGAGVLFHSRTACFPIIMHKGILPEISVWAAIYWHNNGGFYLLSVWYMPGNVLSPLSVGSYYKVNSIVILVFTDEETKTQSVLVICRRSQKISVRTGMWTKSVFWLLVYTPLCEGLWNFKALCACILHSDLGQCFSAYPKCRTGLFACFVLSNLPWADREL